MVTPAFLKHRRPSAVLQALFIAALLASPFAWADDYADVSRLIRAGQYSEALTKSDQYLAGKPKDPQMRFLKGVIQTETGKTQEAIATFTQITRDYPELPEPYNNMAVLYAGQSQFDQARAALEMAIRTNPSYATAHENLGDVYAKLASQAYSKALQLDGANVAVQPKLALIRNLFSVDSKNLPKVAAAAAAAPPAAPAKPAPVAPAAPVVAAAPPAKTAAPAPAAPPAPPAATVAAAPAAAPAAPAAATSASAAAAEKDVEAAVKAWAAAWSGKDMTAYLASYGPAFDTPGSQSRKAWEDERRARIVGKSRISVQLSDVSIAVQGSKATARFKQDYSADALNISSRKTLDLARVSDRWVIVRESSGG